ncbi:hypothetical protein M9H77_02404 [Catharanthus roseus]|uniref:Uncharacterized protein n=1 Tax=Catharanthus roseus TaxID=4058 RepID=A0ACC0C8L8_CATRO|nr:hypothetical protein M9H77_02404 [Catharanthus roseus]
MREFIRKFSQLKLNLPLRDVLLQVLKYERHLRDMIMKKDKLHEASMHILGEECSTLLRKKSVLHVDRALAELDARCRFPHCFDCSFLRTSRALIDMEKGKLVLRVGGNNIVFKFPLHPNTLSKVSRHYSRDDEKGRQLPSKVKARFMKWVPVRHAKEAKPRKHPSDSICGLPATFRRTLAGNHQKQGISTNSARHDR